MFGIDEDEGDFSEIIEGAKSRITRSQDEECDFCGTSEGSVTVSRDEHHPAVSGSPPVVRCRDCFNDPDTYPSDDD